MELLKHENKMKSFWFQIWKSFWTRLIPNLNNLLSTLNLYRKSLLTFNSESREIKTGSHSSCYSKIFNSIKKILIEEMSRFLLIFSISLNTLHSLVLRFSGVSLLPVFQVKLHIPSYLYKKLLRLEFIL